MSPVIQNVVFELLQSFCEYDKVFRNKLFTYMLCLKRNALKTGLRVPKVINFEIIFKQLVKEKMAVKAVHEFISIKNNYEETAEEMTVEYDNGNEQRREIGRFLRALRHSCGLGYDAVMRCIEQRHGLVNASLLSMYKKHEPIDRINAMYKFGQANEQVDELTDL